MQDAPKPPERDVKLYKAGFGTITAASIFEKDLKKRVKQSWRLVSITETGRDAFKKPILTAIYERP